MDVCEHQERILHAMGVTLLLLQATERAMNVCMTFVFQRPGGLTLEVLEKQEKAERKKTLGYFLAELRKRATIEPAFDRTLRDFLDRRNTFIHRLSNVPGWDLQSSKGRRIAEQYVSALAVQSQTLMCVFVGFMRAWQRQIGMQVRYPAGAEKFMAEIDALYAPLIDTLVFKKAPNNKSRQPTAAPPRHSTP